MRRARVLFVVLAAAVLAVSVSAQSTASFSGVVVADPGNQPVRQAVVTIAGDGLAQSRSVVTDDAGRFVFERLPAGRFIVSAAKPAHVTNAMGARRPGRAGTPISIADGQRVTDARVVLPRGAVITGTVRDGSGTPAEGLAVAALPVATLAASAGTLLRPETVLTDDRGVYRIFGLAPGEYVVNVIFRFAMVPEMSGVADVDAVFRELKQGPGRAEPAARVRPVSFAPTYYPSTVRAADAGRIVVGTGEERGGVDITLNLVPTATIEGTLVSAEGSVPAGVSLSLDPVGPRLDTVIGLGVLTEPPGPDGRFRFRSVTPGPYLLMARTGLRGAPKPGAAAPLWARTRLEVAGDDIGGITLTLRPVLRVAGRVVFDGSTLAPPKAGTQVTVYVRDAIDQRIEGAFQTSGGGGMATVAADGSFTAGVLPGRYEIGVGLPSPGSGWVLRSAVIGNRDLADVGVEVGDADLSGLVVTMTDRTSELSGALQTDSGGSATDYVVVAIPADKSLWLPNARRMKVVRPGTDGRFVIRDLPAGEYLVAAATDAEPEDLRNPAFLAQLAAGGVRVTLAEGDRKVQDLRITR